MTVMAGLAGRGVRVAALFIAAVMVTGCTSTPPTPETSSSEFGVLGAEDCSPPSPVIDAEVQGTASPGVTAYGLLFADAPDALPADGTVVKMVVRMTGAGQLRVRLTGPDGAERSLDWGPELHGGSTFRRPGEEWGTGFSFDRSGCWQLVFERSKGARATFWFDVDD